MKLLPLGVRGSTPAPGAEFVRYGGHTSSIAVLADDDPVPRLILDAGTGLRGLTALLGGNPYRGAILLTHLHWDHVQGLPFTRAVDHPAADVRLYVPVRPGGDVLRILGRGFSPPHFPIRPDQLLGHWQFAPLRAGRVMVAGVDSVRVAEVAHKGQPTVGLRVELDQAAVAYLPDHAPGNATAAQRQLALALAHGADVLLHDGQFTADEEPIARCYGHATIGQAMRFADEAQVGELVLTHHAPDRTDDELDALSAAFRCTPGGRPVSFAMQGQPITVRDRRGVRVPGPR